MKILTLNTHSHLEPDYEKKLSEFVKAVCEIKPDIIALQEVNQSIESKPCGGLGDIETLGNIPLKKDNHLLNVMLRLKENGLCYYAVWCGIKNGYPGYEEGAAVMSLSPIEAIKEISLTDGVLKNEWKKRTAVGIKTKSQWFYSVHTGWWEDDEEPFVGQWNILNEVKSFGKTWLMGDFNNPSDKKNEGYTTVINSGWYDTYLLAANKDNGFTATTKIDGWHGEEENKIRIDYIFTSEKNEIESSFVIFDGKNYPKISDHNGIIITF